MLRHPDYDADVYMKWEKALLDNASKFNEGSVYIRAELYTSYGLEEAYKTDLDRDTSLIPLAVGVVSLYIILFLGSWSPIHCRLLAGISGVLCIGLAFVAGCSLMIVMGGKFSSIH